MKDYDIEQIVVDTIFLIPLVLIGYLAIVIGPKSCSGYDSPRNLENKVNQVIQTKNVSGNCAPEKFYVINCDTVYIEKDGLPVKKKLSEDYIK